MTTPPDIAQWTGDPGSIRLCACDVDGTLLTGDHRVPARVAEAISAARATGLRVLLATSRGPGALRSVLDRLPELAGETFVGSQGAITARFLPDGRLDIAHQRRLPAAQAHDLVEIAVAHGLAVSWYSGEHWYVSSIDRTVAREAEIVGVAPEVHDLRALPDGPDKLMLVAPDDDPRTLAPVTAAIGPDLLAQVSNPTYLEITRRDVDKARAVANYCAAAGLDASQVVAVGDGPNDLGMFAFAGLAVAPANARPQVLAAADFTTATNDDAGVAHLLEVLASR